MSHHSAGEEYAEHARRRASKLHADAVRHELDAIALHETLAAQLRRAAEEDRRMASQAKDPSGWQAAAERAEMRAAAAEERAQHARDRLREEGIDPEAETGFDRAAHDEAPVD